VIASRRASNIRVVREILAELRKVADLNPPADRIRGWRDATGARPAELLSTADIEEAVAALANRS
jgi:hypothetical protein